MQYFKSEYISEHVIRIVDIVQTAMYLVIGEKKACLLDTGNGFGDISTYVRTLTDKPIFVILTHGHFDHVGGAALFDEVYMNEKDITLYKQHSDITYRHSLTSQIPGLQDIPLSKYNPVREKPFLPLEDAQVFDLGGITIQMIEVPGHTTGMMMALLPEEQIMLFGDACGVSVMLFEDTSTTVSVYKQSLLHVKQMYESKYTQIIRNHGTFESPLCLLDNVIACCDDIIEHKDDHIPTEIFGQQGFFIAKEKDAKGERIDGLQGNIVYRLDKAV